jgi:hypothetical protein
MKAWLFVGAKVAFKGGGSHGVAKCPHKLVKGEVYTIRGLYETRISKTLAVWLEERPPVAFCDGVEIGWAADNFRPVSTTDTTKTVEAMRNLMLDATVRGKVDA